MLDTIKRIWRQALEAVGLSAAAATNEEIQATIDAFWQANRGKFTSAQVAYRGSHRVFWQGIETPEIPPDDGALVTPDLTKAPTDQPESWADVFVGPQELPAAWPCSIRVDVYEGPRGHGRVTTLIYTKGGERWERADNVGGELEREHGWSKVILGAL